MALKGDPDAPYVIVLEGSATDETKALELSGGDWWRAWRGEEPWGPDGETSRHPVSPGDKKRRECPERPGRRGRSHDVATEWPHGLTRGSRCEKTVRALWSREGIATGHLAGR